MRLFDDPEKDPEHEDLVRLDPSRSTIHSRWRKTSQSVSTTVLGSSPGDADILLKKLHEWGSFLRADEVV